MVETEITSRIPMRQTFVCRVITTKFGLLIETDIRKRTTYPDLKLEVKFRRSGRHLENRYNIINIISAEDGPIWTKFGSLMQSDIPSTVIFETGSSIYFNMADGFFQIGSSYIQPWIKICR